MLSCLCVCQQKVLENVSSSIANLATYEEALRILEYTLVGDTCSNAVCNSVEHWNSTSSPLVSIANICKNIVFGARIAWHHPHLRSKPCYFEVQVMHPLFSVERCLEGFLMYRMIGDSIRT